MSVKEHQIIGKLVAEDYRTASVFKKFGIDFCCQGNRTIADACSAKQIDTVKVIHDLEFAIQHDENNPVDYASWSLDLLLDYIEKKHHRYVEKTIVTLQPYLKKICKVHGENHSELFQINDLFNESARELTTHMKKEEFVLFPYVRKMVKAEEQGFKLDLPQFGNVQNPTEMMMNEHNTEGERFREISRLSDGYTPPRYACNTYLVAFALLKEFEADLHLHIHLENNILFPKVVELEGKLR